MNRKSLAALIAVPALALGLITGVGDASAASAPRTDWYVAQWLHTSAKPGQTVTIALGSTYCVKNVNANLAAANDEGYTYAIHAANTKSGGNLAQLSFKIPTGKYSDTDWYITGVVGTPCSGPPFTQDASGDMFPLLGATPPVVIHS